MVIVGAIYVGQTLRVLLSLVLKVNQEDDLNRDTPFPVDAREKLATQWARLRQGGSKNQDLRKIGFPAKIEGIFPKKAQCRKKR